MLKNLHKLVIKSYVGPLVLTFFIAEFVLIMQFLFLYIGDLVGKGLEWYIIAELLTYASARLAQLALPLAILLASIMTFGNMGEHFELSAMKSAGISLQRIMKPLIIVSVVLSIGSFFFANYVIPYTNLKMGSLLYDISNKRPEMNIKPGVFSNDIPNFSIKIKDKSKTGKMMYGFMIYDHRSHRGNVKVTLADSGFMEITGDQKYMIITLFGGKSYEEMKDERPIERKRPENRTFFDKQVSVFKLEDMDMKRTNENLFRHSHHMQRLGQLEKSSDSLTKVLNRKSSQYVNHLSKSNYFKYEVKYHKSKDSLKYVKDSIERFIPPDSLHVIVNIDSLYQTMDDRVKELVMRLALDNAKSTRKYISVNNDDFYARQKRINKHGIAWHNKFTLAFACLIFFFIGAPLGAIIRKGGFGLPFLVSITFFILYYVVSLMGRKFVEESVLLPWQGMWMSSLLTMPLGVLFTYKATTDSVLFDIGAYFDFVKRLFKVNEIQYRDPDSVFHKDVANLDNDACLTNLEGLKLQAEQLAQSVENDRTWINLYKMQFNYDTLKLESFISNYNSLYPVLAIRNRNNKVYYKSLHKFPKLNLDDYELAKNERIANYIFMSVGIFPIGILLLIRSSFKQKFLRQKIETIKKLLLIFEDNMKNGGEDTYTQTAEEEFYQSSFADARSSEHAGSRTADDDIEISDEYILNAINISRERIQQYLTYLENQTDNLFDFLKLVFSEDINSIDSLPNDIRYLRQLLHKRFKNNRLIDDALSNFFWVDFEKFRMNKQRIFLNYILFGFFLPFAAVVFYLYYAKIQQLIIDLQNTLTNLDDLQSLVADKRYEQSSVQFEDEYSAILHGQSELDGKEQIRVLTDKFYTELQQQINVLQKCDGSIFEFLHCLLTDNISDDINSLNNYRKRVKNFIQEKYGKDIDLLRSYDNFLYINNLEFKNSKIDIFIAYCFLTVFPVGFLYFVIKKKKLETIIREFELFLIDS